MKFTKNVQLSQYKKNTISHNLSKIRNDYTHEVGTSYTDICREEDIEWLENSPACAKVDILQTYLYSPPGEEYRVRRRGANGNYIYYETVKSAEGGLRRLEMERRLTKNQYIDLLATADPAFHPIQKTRYCLAYDRQYFDIDIYPFWNNQAIVEIELSDEKQEIRFPEQIRIIREVTGDPDYKNAGLAKKAALFARNPEQD